MISINIIAENNTYDTSVSVAVPFPAVPREGDTIVLPENKQKELAEKILINCYHLNGHKQWVCFGKNPHLNLDNDTIVKEVDWWPSADGKSIECYLIVTQVDKNAFKRTDFTQEEYLEIKKNTLNIYKSHL